MKILSDSERLEVAIELARVAHAKQVDKCGEPYFHHLQRVANRCQSKSAKIIAYLHDIAEDKHTTHSRLSNLGIFTGHELFCIRALDKTAFQDTLPFALLVQQGVTWHELYLQNLKREGMDLAREVKIADLRDNMDISRFVRSKTPFGDRDRARLKKYERALTFLLE